MKIQKYRPHYFTGFEDKWFEVNSKEELLDCELLKSDKRYKDFFRHSYVADDDDFANIMAEFDNGHEWFVIGNVYGKEDVETLKSFLPKWEHGKVDN